VCYFQPKLDSFRRKLTAYVEAFEEAKTEIIVNFMTAAKGYAGI